VRDEGKEGGREEGRKEGRMEGWKDGWITKTVSLIQHIYFFWGV
jgi:predicted transposase YdaD